MEYGKASVIGLITCMVIALVLPMPGWTLDLLLSANLAASLAVFSLSLMTSDRFCLQHFGGVMVVSSLIRVALALSVARSILFNGSESSLVQGVGLAATSSGIATGIAVVVLLALVDLLVISAGTVRVAEVMARFALDAMPGRQMALDSAIAAGQIDTDEAMAGREEIVSECTFYGAMDGAARFLRGDIIATLCIVAITPLAAIIGQMDQGLSSVGQYINAMVGHGILLLFPAFLVGSAGALIIARANEREAFGAQIADGIVNRPETLLIGAVVLILMSCVIPTGRISLAMAGLLVLLGVLKSGWLRKKPSVEQSTDQAISFSATRGVQIEIGFGLVDIVQVDGFEAQLSQLRSRVEQQTGVAMAPLVISDNAQLAMSEMRVLWQRQIIARCEIRSKAFLALGLDADQVAGAQQAHTGDVELGSWISEKQVMAVERMGIEVLDAVHALLFVIEDRLLSTVAERFDFEDAHALMGSVGETHPAALQCAINAGMDTSVLCRIGRNLLAGRIGLRNFSAIVQAVAELSPTLGTEELTEGVRRRMARTICEAAAPDGELLAIALAPDLSARLRENAHAGRPAGVGFGEGWHAALCAWGRETYRRQHPICILCEPEVRPVVQRLLVDSGQPLMALSFDELMAGYAVRILATIEDMDLQLTRGRSALYEGGVS